ncbi:MAG: hypothetical protein LBV23_12105 [Deltaproteobacteria bacterium]|nr:hypothetical protein [Deltaproteobacteria bacterium]
MKKFPLNNDLPFSSTNRFLSEAALNQSPNPEGQGEPSDFFAVPTEAMVRHESMLINEVCLILAEKRTALSIMRTGLAILVLPLSVASVLIAISRYYDPGKVIYLLAPVLLICLVLSIFGFYLIYRAWVRTKALEEINSTLKMMNPHLKALCSMIERQRRPL